MIIQGAYETGGVENVYTINRDNGKFETEPKQVAKNKLSTKNQTERRREEKMLKCKQIND